MDKLEVIKKPIEKELSEFKALFDASLKSSTPLLDEVLGYIKQRNGKMMRPILVLLMAKLYGGINDSTLHAALSLELLHTASLVHDDVVDESNKRRGQSSVNALYDNKVSVLVGDYMLATSLRHASYTNHIELVGLVARLEFGKSNLLAVILYFCFDSSFQLVGVGKQVFDAAELGN